LIGDVLSQEIRADTRSIHLMRKDDEQTTTEILQLLEKFWAIEEVAEPKYGFSEEEEHCQRFFLDTTSIAEDGRLEV
jgi:hypothetical protein